MKIKKIY